MWAGNTCTDRETGGAATGSREQKEDGRIKRRDRSQETPENEGSEE